MSVNDCAKRFLGKRFTLTTYASYAPPSGMVDVACWVFALDQGWVRVYCTLRTGEHYRISILGVTTLFELMHACAMYLPDVMGGKIDGNSARS
ncbi:MAG: hypothetical protein V3S69_07255 [Dehalococcoidales bacterium]